MKDILFLKDILKAGNLTSELDLARAQVLDRKLRLLVKENAEYAEDRKRLRAIIHAYESEHWSVDSDVSEDKIKESDSAIYIAEKEREFIERRKYVIKENLEMRKISQQELGKILGHSKSYMSELMNGVSPFSLKDLIIIHRLFVIDLKILVPLVISQQDRDRVKSSISALNKPELKLKKDELEFA